jgi:acyl carrier protein
VTTTAPEARAAAVIARAFNIQGEVAPDADMASLPAWDSMNHVTLLLELEKELGRPLRSDEIGSIDSVRSIARLLDAATGR